VRVTLQVRVVHIERLELLQHLPWGRPNDSWRKYPSRHSIVFEWVRVFLNLFSKISEFPCFPGLGTRRFLGSAEIHYKYIKLADGCWHYCRAAESLPSSQN
jgi:hypothetical protein